MKVVAQMIPRIIMNFVLLVGAGVYVNAANNEIQSASGNTAGAVAVAATGVTPGTADEKINIPLKIAFTCNDRVSVNVDLLANVEVKRSICLDYQIHWEYTFTNMPKYDDEGNEIIKSKVAIPDYITVKLLADCEEVLEAELNNANNWKHTFANLQKYNNSNNEIKYTVKEVGEDGKQIVFDGKIYKVTYKSSAEDGFTVMNEKEVPLSTTQKTSTPKKYISSRTGDESNFALYACLLGASRAALAFLSYRRRKHVN